MSVVDNVIALAANVLGSKTGGVGTRGIGGDGMYENWPLSKFSFKVYIRGIVGEVSFETMDGLGATIAKMEFRDGNSQKFYKQHRPTLTSYDPVTLKKGVFESESALYSWFDNVSTTILFGDRRTVVIDLTEIVGGVHKVMYKWTLEGAYVTKFTPPSLDGGAEGEVAVEEIELSYQTFSAMAL